MRQVIQCLIDWLESWPNDDKPYLVLRALAKESIKVAGYEEDFRRFTGANLVDVVFNDSEEEKPENPNKWIAWSKSLEPYWKSRKPQIIDFARKSGMESYPELVRKKGGGRGKETTYWIKAVPLLNIGDDELEDALQTEPYQTANKITVDYELAAHGEVEPAWIAKWLFRNGQIKLSLGHVWGIIVSLLLIGGIPVVFSYLIWLTLLAPQPITTRELTSIITIFGLPYLVWIAVIKPWVRLFDDRIVLADGILVAFKEKPAQFELLRDGDLRFIRLVRYTAPCPICGATIYLEDGSPDYPRRLVGRCYDSPREHVYSFDRVTRRGIILRGAGLN